LASSVVAVLALAVPLKGYCTDWLMLDATEPVKAPPVAGSLSISLQYQASNDTPLLAGPWRGQPDQFNRFAPRYANGRVLQVPNAGIGIHGRLWEGAVNYRVTLATGDNPTLRDQAGFFHGRFGRLTDASATMNSIPDLRIRVGLFRQPLGDEAAAPQQRYIWPSHVTQQMVQERYFRSDGGVDGDPNLDLGPVSTYRDIGVEVFNAFRRGPWVHTYALMLGRGTGIDPGLNSAGPDTYVYWSSERVFGGAGLRQEGLKFFAWGQSGQRSLTVGPRQAKEALARQRAGVGATLRKGPWSFAGEWIYAKGLIYHGPDGGTVPGRLSNDGPLLAGYNVLPSSKADGWYADLGYQVIAPFEMRLRYDVLNRGTDDRNTDIRFQALTIGGVYRLTPTTQVIVDYQFRRYDAPLLPRSSPTNLLLDGVDNRFGVRLTQQWNF
jgi:hypothetical protein